MEVYYKCNLKQLEIAGSINKTSVFTFNFVCLEFVFDLEKHVISAQHSHCHSNPCVHGLCTETMDGYSCTCNSGYMGKNCDIGK